jgi:hypothetical protein
MKQVAICRDRAQRVVMYRVLGPNAGRMRIDLRPPADGTVIKTHRPTEANPVSPWRFLKEPSMETVFGRGRKFGEYGLG